MTRALDVINTDVHLVQTRHRPCIGHRHGNVTRSQMATNAFDTSDHPLVASAMSRNGNLHRMSFPCTCRILFQMKVFFFFHLEKMSIDFSETFFF